ncbi:MAG: DNA polymerase IV [Pirellulaceae bacterium]|nr:DNA polymerase IV [Pirellulaceae bacterium]
MILHIDMDAFYASVEQRDAPQLRNRPVIVGGSSAGRGVVCAASYEARKFGIHSAMPAAQAKRQCPHAIFLSPRMSHYAEISAQIREIFHRYTPLIEPLSLDEAFLDVTGSEALFGTSEQIGQQIKAEIAAEVDLIASVGIAPNKFLAKIASDLEKPNGFVVVTAEQVDGFLAPLPVSRLWGVGRITGQAFSRIGVRTIADLRRLPLQSLIDQFGEHGAHLAKLSHGIDPRPVIPDRQAKSISHETTFAQDISDQAVLRAWIVELANQVAWRLRQHNFLGRTVQLKIRLADFQTMTRAQQLPTPTNVTDEIQSTALGILEQQRFAQPIRLLGLSVSGLDNNVLRQKNLFHESTHDTQQRIDAATDQIRDRFGKSSLTRGSSMMYGANHRPQPRPHEPDSPQSESEQE